MDLHVHSGGASLGRTARVAAAALAVLGALSSCGAAQKVESGGEQLDRAVDRDSKKLEREIKGLLEEDAGPATDAAAEA
jgi:hypothetical protein